MIRMFSRLGLDENALKCSCKLSQCDYSTIGNVI